MAGTKNALIHGKPNTVIIDSVTLLDNLDASLSGEADHFENLSDADTQALDGGLNQRRFSGQIITMDPQARRVLKEEDEWTGDGATGATFKIVWPKKGTLGTNLTATMPTTHNGRITRITPSGGGDVTQWTIEFIVFANASGVTAAGFTFA